MAKIAYENQGKPYQNKCPFGFSIRVGSTACTENCKYFVSIDTDKKIVVCRCISD